MVKAGASQGFVPPWAYIRRQLARDWYVSPEEFDRIIEANPEELRIELAIRRCEAAVEG